MGGSERKSWRNYENLKFSTNFSYDDDTSSEFFIGGLNKEKTRDELFRQLCNVTLSNGQKLYVKKFNMPKINAYKDSQNRVICTPGYAFITTKDSWMAQELVKKGFIMMDGFKVEIKSIQAAKRLSSKKNEMEKKKRVRKQFEDDNKFAS